MVTVDNCGRVQAYAGGAGQTATLKQASASDPYINLGAVVESKGSGYDNIGNFFGHTYATANNGVQDAAYFYGASSGANTFQASPNIAYLYGSSYYNEGDNFGHTYATANNRAQDVTYLYGAAGGSNTFQASPTVAYFYGTGY